MTALQSTDVFYYNILPTRTAFKWRCPILQLNSQQPNLSQW